MIRSLRFIRFFYFHDSIQKPPACARSTLALERPTDLDVVLAQVLSHHVPVLIPDRNSAGKFGFSLFWLILTILIDGAQVKTDTEGR